MEGGHSSSAHQPGAVVEENGIIAMIGCMARMPQAAGAAATVEGEFKAALAALAALVEQVKRDRSILAAILCGSLSHDTVWAKSDIDLLLITIDDKRLRRMTLPLRRRHQRARHPDAARRFPQNRGRLHSQLLHAFAACQRTPAVHATTRALPLSAKACTSLASGTRSSNYSRPPAMPFRAVYKAHKWLLTRGDLEYTALWILYCRQCAGEDRSARSRLARRSRSAAASAQTESIVFQDHLHGPAEREEDAARRSRRALSAIDGYLLKRATTIFAPMIEHLTEVGEARSATEIEDHFKRNFGVEGVTGACEYLADQGLIGKAPLPVRLTKTEQRRRARSGLLLRNQGSRCLVARKPAAARPSARTTIAVQGARVHNLKNVSLELPRDRLIVVTGLSGSGKSSLAFDTIYAEGQRRYMESLSSYAKRFVSQVAKPDVDFIYGLSPVISIEQKTTGSNPRSTVGTMTDIASYLNLLFATIAEPHCPRTGERVAQPHRQSDSGSDPGAARRRRSRTPGAGIQGVRRGTGLCLHRSPQEGLPSTHRRRPAAWISPMSSRSMNPTSPTWMPWSTALIVGRKHEKAIKAAIAATLLVGDGLMQIQVIKGASKSEADRFYKGLCSPTHHFVYGGIEPEYFMFNNPESACRTCGGLGVHKITHPELLVPDPKRSIRGGCFVKEAYKYNPDTWDGRIMYTLSTVLKFSLDTPWEKLPETVRHSILYGLDGRKLRTIAPPESKVKREDWDRHEIGFGGIARRIERQYRRYRQRGEANSGMEEWLDKVMVERTCPDCGGARLRATRLLFTIAGKTIHEVGALNFDELYAFLASVKPAGRGARGRTPGGHAKSVGESNCCSA